MQVIQCVQSEEINIIKLSIIIFYVNVKILRKLIQNHQLRLYHIYQIEIWILEVEINRILIQFNNKIIIVLTLTQITNIIKIQIQLIIFIKVIINIIIHNNHLHKLINFL
jgi:hypothetical protein